jgi:hypothetical protein
MPLDELLRRRFTSFRTIHLPTVSRLTEHGFGLLPLGSGHTSPSTSIARTMKS